MNNIKINNNTCLDNNKRECIKVDKNLFNFKIRGFIYDEKYYQRTRVSNLFIYKNHYFKLILCWYNSQKLAKLNVYFIANKNPNYIIYYYNDLLALISCSQ